MVVKHAKHVQINTDILLGGSFRSTYIFLIRMYPVKTKGEPKAGAGFLTNYQPKSGANHICHKNATQSRGNLVSVQIDILFGA